MILPTYSLTYWDYSETNFKKAIESVNQNAIILIKKKIKLNKLILFLP